MVLTIIYLEKKLYKRVCVTIGNPAFCITLYLTGVHFRGENVRQKLQHVGHVGQQKMKVSPIRTREIVGVRL